MENTNDFIGYDYKEKIVNQSNLSLFIDGYENFGWQLDERLSNQESDTVHLHLKRDRKLVNKVELTRLERHFETCMDELDHLEKNKTKRATIYSLSIGVVGCAFMALSVFTITGNIQNYVLMVLFAIPGFVLWILPYFLYKKMKAEDTIKMDELIDKKYEEINMLFEKGIKLLH